MRGLQPQRNEVHGRSEIMYEPQEDSFLLAQSVKSHARGCVLDMGTGTGIQAITAAQCSRVKKIIAIDLDKHALTYAKKTQHAQKNNLSYKQPFLQTLTQKIHLHV